MAVQFVRICFETPDALAKPSKSPALTFNLASLSPNALKGRFQTRRPRKGSGSHSRG